MVVKNDKSIATSKRGDYYDESDTTSSLDSEFQSKNNNSFMECVIKMTDMSNSKEENERQQGEDEQERYGKEETRETQIRQDEKQQQLKQQIEDVHSMIIRSVSSIHSSWSQDGVVYQKQNSKSSFDSLNFQNSFSTATGSIQGGEGSNLSNNLNVKKTIKAVNLILYLWLGLAASSLLAFLAGLDATLHCTVAYNPTIYEYNNTDDSMDDYYVSNDDIYDENEKRKIEENFCISLFTTVIVPVSTIAIFAAVLAGFILLQPKLIFSRFVFNDCCKDENADANQLLREQRRKQLLSLGILSLTALLVWSYAIVIIMLKPPLPLTFQQRRQQYDDDFYSSNDDTALKNFEGYVKNTVRKEQFQSLGAVNILGAIGDNANLYYSSWGSICLSFALVYNYAFGNKIFSTQASWRYSFYRLRERIGPWIVILLSCLLILGSSIRIWRAVISRYRGSSEDLEEDLWALISSTEVYYHYLHNENAFIRGTWLAVLLGFIGSILSTVAVFLHWSESFLGSPSVPLVLESTLTFLLTVLFCSLAGYVVCSGGPAQTVGNLYYATMIALIFSLRIGLGCIEEILNIHDPFLSKKKFLVRRIESNFNDADIYEMMMQSKRSYKNIIYTEAGRKERKGYLRRWGILAVCSAVSFASALDSARNYGKITHKSSEYFSMIYPTNITTSQYWTITAPSIVMIIASIFFLLCLFPRTYLFVYEVKIGGVCSCITFFCWLTVIITIQHSDTSLAINEHGEILTANLYYFTWASIITAGMNTATYTERVINTSHAQESFMVVLWFSVVKVCFVVLSSSLHIWWNIRNACPSTFFLSSYCFRTKFAMVVGALAEILAFLAAMSRIFKFKPFVLIETIVACILATSFIFGAALITGMSGPGQSVGDLYYATWIALFFSLMIVREQIGHIISTKNLNPIPSSFSQNTMQLSTDHATSYVQMNDSSHLIASADRTLTMATTSKPQITELKSSPQLQNNVEQSSTKKSVSYANDSLQWETHGQQISSVTTTKSIDVLDSTIQEPFIDDMSYVRMSEIS